MFQSHVLFKANSYDRIPRKRNWFKSQKIFLRLELSINSMLLAEGKGVTATSLGQRPSGGGKYLKFRVIQIIHRVPSGEGVTATSLGNRIIGNLCKEKNRNNTPIELSLCNNYKTKEIVNGA